MNNLLVVIFFVAATSTAAFNVELSPNPELRQVGQRPIGSRLAVLCRVTGLPEGEQPETLLWKIPVNATNSVEIRILDPFTASLLIKKGFLADNGIYICTAAYNGTEKSAVIDITFFEELQFLDDLTDIESPKDGQSLNISCLIKPTHEAEVVTMWEKGIVALTPKSERGYAFFADNQILQISNYRNEIDEGTYSCKVFDQRSGSMIIKSINVGRIQLKKKQFCQGLCSSLCHSLYTKP